MVRVRAPAKVNLFLEVLAKRADGYHEISTLMVAVSLYDTLEFKEEPSGQTRLECDNPHLSTGPDNLVRRAADLLRRHIGRDRGAHVRLRKRIPMAAGLAGGSTDAAAALEGLNRLWRLGLTRTELAALGAQLGSDVPFFFATPAAWCTGRGEKVEPLAVGNPLWLVLVSPPAGLSTAAVYRNVTVPGRPETGEDIRRAVVEGNVEEVGRRLHNRLQEPAERLCPEVARLHARLRALGPAGALMSGSGSSLFALCRGRAEALRIARASWSGPAEEARPRVTVVRSCV
ncbi:MAG TPA: 4-(cytidine 5'-diphospho)-2-C-methyl-D-erythritol kinase [Gemmataceae bacterium]|nr:4-(cytidine 5'-diphospho)-2-C-methyl-D-erythritol kinase [Gemmataceae bacterium]